MQDGTIGSANGSSRSRTVSQSSGDSSYGDRKKKGETIRLKRIRESVATLANATNTTNSCMVTTLDATIALLSTLEKEVEDKCKALGVPRPTLEQAIVGHGTSLGSGPSAGVTGSRSTNKWQYSMEEPP